MRLINWTVLPIACKQAPKVHFEENKNMLSPRERYGDLFIDAQMAAAFPLYFGMADQSQADQTAQVLQKEFLKSSGLVSTKNNTGQQWDAPNGWGPLQLIAIDGFGWTKGV